MSRTFLRLFGLAKPLRAHREVHLVLETRVLALREQLGIVGDHVAQRIDPGALSFREVAEHVRVHHLLGNAPGFSFGAAAAEVEVDEETGQVRILRIAHAYDVGFAVNPLGVEGQLQGGAAQSIGRLLTEELIYDNGQILNPSYLNYKMLTAADMPRVIPIIVEEPEIYPFAPYGVKELGMGAISACGSAVVNAAGSRIKAATKASAWTISLHVFASTLRSTTSPVLVTTRSVPTRVLGCPRMVTEKVRAGSAAAAGRARRVRSRTCDRNEPASRQSAGADSSALTGS